MHALPVLRRTGPVLLTLGCLLAAPQPGEAAWRTRWRPCPAPVVIIACPQAVEGPREAVRRVLDLQVEAWNKGDLEGFMAGYWRSPELTFQSGNTVTRGWQATLDRYKARYQGEGREMGKLTFRDVEIELLGPDAALVRGRWELVKSNENPKGLFTLLFKKLPEGWRIVHDHTSG